MANMTPADTSTITAPSSTPAVVASEWEIDRLDVAAYLARLGYIGPLEPTEEVLIALHRAHAETIPFENLEIILGGDISLDLDDIQHKLVRNRRGGYCYEHNLLFAALLERAGFEVTRLVARVNPDRPGPRTHMTLNVLIGNHVWLADVGFGAALLEPIRREDGAESHQEQWVNGIYRDEHGLWRLRTRDDGGWRDLYAFTEEPQRPNDYRVYNHYVSTHPASPFASQLVIIRLTPSERLTLRSTELTKTDPGGSETRTQVPVTDLHHLLSETFGITLADAEFARLADSLGHADAMKK